MKAMADSGSWITVAGLLLGFATAVIVAIAVWRDGPRRRAAHLRERFGPEYDIAVQQYGERRAARELEARELRVSRLPLRSLPPAERSTLAQSWSLTQQHFVDAPQAAVRQAYELVLRTLVARGYQVDDFEVCVADLSVDYGGIVQHLRAAHILDQANREGRANTEELRQALVHYRALFEGLLGTPRERVPPASQRYQPVLEHHHISAPR
jgi:hypothetical protein